MTVLTIDEILTGIVKERDSYQGVIDKTLKTFGTNVPEKAQSLIEGYRAKVENYNKALNGIITHNYGVA